MTFHETFYADQAFLEQAQNIILEANIIEPSLNSIISGVLSCSFALESIVNQLYIKSGVLKHYDRLNIEQKIETLGDFCQIDIAYGIQPWSELRHLIKVRNWLVHYKEPVVGFIGSESGYIRHNHNDTSEKLPVRGVQIDLQSANLSSYYFNLLTAMKQLAEALNLKAEFNYLFTEKYVPYLLG